MEAHHILIGKAGTKYYHKDREMNILHRTDGPAIEWYLGDKEWMINNENHRIDGPAIEYSDGGKEWWVNGKRHRTDGPAIERANGSKEYFVNNKYVSEEEFNNLNSPEIVLSMDEVSKLKIKK